MGFWNGSGITILPELQWILNEVTSLRASGSAYVPPPPPPTAKEILQAQIDAEVKKLLVGMTQGTTDLTPLSRQQIDALNVQVASLKTSLQNLPASAPASVPPVDLTPLQAQLDTLNKQVKGARAGDFREDGDGNGHAYHGVDCGPDRAGAVQNRGRGNKTHGPAAPRGVVCRAVTAVRGHSAHKSGEFR